MKIMASSPITSWQIDGETMATMTDFIFLDSKITVDGEWSHNIKGYFLLERKSMTNLDSVLKKQRYYFVNKDTYSQSSGFSSSHVWMWELDHKEGWTPKNWFFWSVVVEKTLESPWTAKRSNQSILKGISPEYSLEGLMLKLKLQYFSHMMRRTGSLEKTWCWERLKAGGVGDDRWFDGLMD